MALWASIAETLGRLRGSLAAYLASLAPATTTAPEKSVAFTIGMIALGAKMAKADGRVTTDEVAAFKQVFHVPQENMAEVARVFDLAKQDVAGFDVYAKRIARLFGKGSPVLEDVLDGLFHIAKADLALHENELLYLSDVSHYFGFTGAQFETIKARNNVQQNLRPYQVLGVKRDDDLATIKAKYRALVRENHPDKHIAQGMPVEMIELATDRLAAINGAYEAILKERGA